ncbi:MAG: magnesium chelatase [Candidatus Bathyarchaeota archaeon]
MAESTSSLRPGFPFTALVDQEHLKLALILNAINPRIGGVLIRGAKGTGKSTAVRSLIDLLPEIDVVKGCPFGCIPYDFTNMCEICRSRASRVEGLPVERRKMKVVNLPIGATDDRVAGTLDIEKAIKDGVMALEAGLLAEANQNVLYVDEINLLPDHIADIILDAAASGWNVVEREGLSVQHPSRFIFVGTMNPEEGELRPQLLDRMPLHTEVATILDMNLRVDVMKTNVEFEEDPIAFRQKFQERQGEMFDRILKAKQVLRRVVLADNLLETIARMCISLQVDGHRPDIVIVKTSKTLAAYNGREEVLPEDILASSLLTLSHRTRNLGVEPPAALSEIESEFKRSLSETKS